MIATSGTGCSPARIEENSQGWATACEYSAFHRSRSLRASKMCSSDAPTVTGRNLNSQTRLPHTLTLRYAEHPHTASPEGSDNAEKDPQTGRYWVWGTGGFVRPPWYRCDSDLRAEVRLCSEYLPRCHHGHSLRKANTQANTQADPKADTQTDAKADPQADAKADTDPTLTDSSLI